MRFTNQLEAILYTPAQQGSGEFDNGKITEIKPIDFPGGTSQAKRIGPLFYWAWASANGDGVIGMHPHRAFEIMSYVIKGEIGHTDSLGNRSRVGEGGAQVMQTGSGVMHQEEMYGERTEFFQIWFEPNLQQSVKKQPTYNEFRHGDFPVVEQNGVTVKTLLGEESLIILDAQVKMEDVIVQPGSRFQRELFPGNSLAVVTVSGSGKWFNDENDSEIAISKEDFTVFNAAADAVISVENSGNDELRQAMIEIPQRVDYPLYG